MENTPYQLDALTASRVLAAHLIFDDKHGDGYYDLEEREPKTLAIVGGEYDWCDSLAFPKTPLETIHGNLVAIYVWEGAETYTELFCINEKNKQLSIQFISDENVNSLITFPLTEVDAFIELNNLQFNSDIIRPFGPDDVIKEGILNSAFNGASTVFKVERWMSCSPGYCGPLWYTVNPDTFGQIAVVSSYPVDEDEDEDDIERYGYGISDWDYKPQLT